VHTAGIAERETPEFQRVKQRNCTGIFARETVQLYRKFNA
jgi:hypothetical protein